ncbi:hypothetical protein M5K25_009222 [Dendrobium thyrsiflorum]|uniref:Acyl carrier protein n=1 Tax=Dendrobium thyrsiflorum TaxID=117978 RepID=A0ABD0VBS4_DENTH
MASVPATTVRLGSALKKTNHSDKVEIVMGFEEEFGITLEEDNSQNISTVQESADLIEKLLKKDAEI